MFGGTHSGTVESTMTTVSPYARLALTDRVSARGLADWGTGAMAMTEDGRDPVKTDIGLRFGAVGGRGALVEQDGRGASTLRSRPTSSSCARTGRRSQETDTAADTSRVRRVRLVLEGGLTFAMDEGATRTRSPPRRSIRGGVVPPAEAGYGVSLFGGRFTATPNTGLALSDGGARDWRIGWRLTSAVPGNLGFEVSLDATRREAAGDDAAPKNTLRLELRVRF